MTHRVLVLDANQRSALAITRSLGRHPNITVLTADETAKSLAGTSRFSCKYLRSPSPANHPGAFIDWLAQTIRCDGITQVFPVTEVSTYTSLMHQERLEPCKLVFPQLSTVQALADKCRLIARAAELGIPYPSSQLVRKATEFDPRTILHYPVVLKPCYSRICHHDTWLSSSVHIAQSREDLTNLITTRPYLRDHPFMVQDFIPGGGAGVFALYQHGQAIVFFSHRRIREKPPTGGVSVLSESTSLDPHLKEMTKRLLDDVKWHGVAMAEFRITPDGQPYLMEVNPRFWGSLQLAIDCGIDFPYLVFQIAAGHTVCTPEDYPVGRRLRWFLGDLDSLYLCLRDPHRYTALEKLRRVASFFHPSFTTTRHEVNRIDDIGPAQYELVEYLRHAFRRRG